MKILRFYGSCGHIEDEEILEERFFELTKEQVYAGIPYKNEISKENENDVVHIHPFRFFLCNQCIMKEIEND